MGFLNAALGYTQTTFVGREPGPEVILEVLARDGSHAQAAIGVATVPLNLPLVISAEVELR